MSRSVDNGAASGRGNPAAARGAVPRAVRIPLPKEHGAWVMVYAPSLACLLGFGPPALPFAVFLVCITAVFFGQNGLGVVLRRRGGAAARWWLALCAATALASAALLVFVYGHTDLVWPGAVGAALLARQLFTGLASGKRIDRSVLGQVLAVGGLSLTGLAACIVATGSLGVLAAGLWLLFWSKFVSGILHVKMLVNAARPASSGSRWMLGKDLVAYHIGLLVAVSAVCAALGWRSGWLIAAAYLPLFVRSGVGLWRLSDRLPRLKRVGLLEVGYTAWFVVFTGLLIRVLSGA